ncbi:arginine--tRNA ligase [Candidatus Woesearchaeota archaeon]|nr:arginine--tRNA ligase [Candidatus Woesearchaeota archaeon]
MDFEKEIRNIIKKNTGLKSEEIVLEIPLLPEFGDYAFVCFILSKKEKKNPVQIASNLKESIENNLEKYWIIEKVENKGPYLNFFLKRDLFVKETLNNIFSDNYLKNKIKKEKVLLEFPAPNTNKPLHLGHLRNIFIGQSVANILEFIGCEVVKINLNNDIGKHVCKTMLAYEKWHENETPKIKKDHYIGDLYVEFEKKARKNPTLEEENDELLVKWENNDKETRKRWKKLKAWCLEGFKETYDKLSLKFEKEYFESDFQNKGKEIVKKALKKGIFKKHKEGFIYAPLKKYGLDNKIILRSDGTSLYITQDLVLAKKKYDDFKMDKSVYVVASEQNLYFKQLFKILEMLGKGLKEYPEIDNYHLSYGMIFLPEGRMKSREGNVVDADDLIDEMEKLAGEEVRKRHPDMKEKELNELSKKIGLSALRFFMLKYDLEKDFIFNPEKSIDFEGDTGPYVQYAYVRIMSIFEKWLNKNDKKIKEKIKNLDVDLSLLNKEIEYKLVKSLYNFNDVAEKASERYDSSLIANYLLELAQTFNSFYHECPILQEKGKLKNSRLFLAYCTKEILKKGLNLLDIDVVDLM